MREYTVGTKWTIYNDCYGSFDIEDGDDYILIKQKDLGGAVTGTIELDDPELILLLIDAMKHASVTVWGETEDE